MAQITTSLSLGCPAVSSLPVKPRFWARPKLLTRRYPLPVVRDISRMSV
jgi:hypothetical protein